MRTRMIMFEKSDGTVAMHCGVIEEVDYVAAEDHLLTLPNTVSFIVDFFFCYIHRFEAFTS